MTKKLLKIYSAIFIFWSVCLLSPLLFSIHTQAAADTTPPRITSVSVDKTVAHVGDTVTFTVTVEEDESGFGGISFSLENLDRTIYFPYEAMFLDVALNFDEEHYTGTYQMSKVITEDVSPGNYLLKWALICDGAGNENRYVHYEYESLESEYNIYQDQKSGDQFTVPKNVQLTVINDAYDNYLELPSATIKSVELKGHDILYNETVPVDVEFEGQVPDVFSFNMGFIDEDHGLQIGAGLQNVSKDDCLHDGMLYHLNLEFQEESYASLRTGNYRVSSLALSEKGKDLSFWYSYRIDDELNLHMTDDRTGITCEILGDTQLNFTEDITRDRTLPVFEQVTVQEDKITRPGIITVDVTVSDDIEVGDTYLSICRDNIAVLSQSESILLSDADSENPKRKSSEFKLFIPRYTSLGIYQLVLDTYDSTGNWTRYSTDIEIVEEFDVAFTYGINNPNLLQKINDLKERETGFIKVGYSKINVKKEIFEAIQDRDVNLVFYSDYYEWICNGKDVTNPKDIVVGLDLYMASENGFDFLVLEFPDNGTLPGKTHMRVQSDFLKSMWDDSNTLFLYYVKSDGNLERQYTKIDYVGDGITENWCYFDITHNSNYYLSGKALKMSRKVKSIKLTGLSHKILPGKKIQLKAVITPTYAKNKKLKWTSSNKKVATVSQSGKVTIKKNTSGKKVTITAKATDGTGKKATWKITVMKGAVKKITVKGHKKTLKAGKSMQLLADVKVSKAKPNNKSLKWISSNSKYATVTQFGLVTAKKAGKGKIVTITVMSTDGTNKKVKKKIKIK